MYTKTFKYGDWHLLFMLTFIIISSHNVISSGLICIRVHTTLSLQKVITFYDYFRKKNMAFL